MCQKRKVEMGSVVIRWCEGCGLKGYALGVRETILSLFLVPEVRLEQSERAGEFRLLVGDRIVFDKDQAQRFPEEDDIRAALAGIFPAKSKL